MNNHRNTILRWHAKGIPVDDIKAALTPRGVTEQEIIDTINNATRLQTKQALATPEFIEPPLFEEGTDE